MGWSACRHLPTPPLLEKQQLNQDRIVNLIFPFHHARTAWTLRAPSNHLPFMSRCPVSGRYLDCAGRNVMPQRDEPVSLYFPTVSQVRQGHTGRGLGGLVNNTTRPRWFALLCFRSCRRAIMMFRNFMQLNTSSFCRVDRVSVSCRPDMHRQRLETPAVHLGKVR